MTINDKVIYWLQINGYQLQMLYIGQMTGVYMLTKYFIHGKCVDIKLSHYL
jgi:hypothetical protein